MHLIIEHKVRRPYAHTLFSPEQGHGILMQWTTHLALGDCSAYGDITFVITPDPADARSVDMAYAIGDLELMRIDEIRSILIMENEV